MVLRNAVVLNGPIERNSTLQAINLRLYFRSFSKNSPVVVVNVRNMHTNIYP